jgi:hypothetical protein
MRRILSLLELFVSPGIRDRGEFETEAKLSDVFGAAFSGHQSPASESGGFARKMREALVTNVIKLRHDADPAI